MAQWFLQTVWLIPLYALIGAGVALFWSPAIIHRTGPRPSGYVNLIMTAIAFIHAWVALVALGDQPAQYLTLDWLQVAGLDINLPLEISSLTIGTAMLICGLNLLAQVFALGYLEMDWGWARFYSFLGLFEAGMSALAFSQSLFFGYMILEVLTLGTYLLVGLWFSQPLVVTGARDAFLTKRIGDLILLIGVVALLPIAKTWNFQELATWATTAHLDPTVATLLGLALIAGPMGKCAQFPLHLWLDEAMEGPIPASILRNSIIVPVGTWILVKLEPVLSLSPTTLTVMEWVGGITAVFGSLIAIAQIDVKRALSYLVSAYMGLTFIAVANGETSSVLLFVLTYSISMALLLMGVGGIIWNNISQDLRQYGGLWSRRPVGAFSIIIGAIGLLAVPPFGGFWSIVQMTSPWADQNPLMFGVFVFVNGATAFGLTRVIVQFFGGKSKQMTERSPEIHWPMALPMITTMGVVFHLPLLLHKWQLIPALDQMLETFTSGVALTFLASTLVGVIAGGAVYLNQKVTKPVKLPFPAVQDLFAYDFYTPQIYKVTVVFVVGIVSNLIALFDQYLVDGFVNLVGSASVLGGESLKYSTSGQSQFYALTIILGITFLGFVLVWPLISTLSLVG